MKIVILTTHSRHHAYFIYKLSERFDVAAVIYEQRLLSKPYPTGPFFDAEQDNFEEHSFGLESYGVYFGTHPVLSEKSIEVYSINQVGIADYLRAQQAQVLVVFGTGRLNREIIDSAEWGSINVHRGIARYYRGLDADLWAALDGRLDRIGVTLHQVFDELDVGDIFAQETIRINSECEVYHLRYHTTILATELMISVLERFRKASGPISGDRQDVIGPYYSSMSLDQKYRALEKFNRLKKL